MTSQLQIFEEERRKLLLHEQNLITAHKDHLTKLHSHLRQLDGHILRLKQSEFQQTSEDQQARAKSSEKVKVGVKAKDTTSSADAWQCLCGNMLKGDRKRCGKCLKWRGGKRGKSNADSNPPIIQRVVSSNDDEWVPTTTKRKRGRKASRDSASAVPAVTQDDEQAAASLLSLSLSL